MIGATKLPDIFKFLQDYKALSGDLDLLYEKNVRKFLGNKRKVNKGIEQTLEQHPERFGLYNNGITIVAEEVEKSGSGGVTLKNPFVVNGCQTTRSIWSVLQRRLNSGGSAPNTLDQIWCWRARTLLLQVPMITDRDRLAVVEPFYVSDDLGQDPTEPVADGDDTSAIKLRRLDVQEIIDCGCRASFA